MRILAWNIWGGSRRQRITEVVRTVKADVVVLSDCRPSNYVSLATDLHDCGFAWVTGTNQGDYTGMLIASRLPMYPGSTSSAVLPGHWCHIQIPSVHLSVVGIYGPLRRDGVANPVSPFWNDLLQASKRLSTEPAALVGDLNTALAPGDTTSGLPMPASKELQGLVASGWRDIFRELHGERPEYSYWDARGAYRIDYGMLSPAAPAPYHAEYIRELAGYSLGRWSKDPKATLASDHAALVFEIG